MRVIVPRVIPLAVVLALLAAALAAGSSGASAQETQRIGLFGEVTLVESPAAGLTVLTLDTVSGGIRTVEATDEATAVVVPGRDQASLADISVGDFLAVVAESDDGGTLLALSVLVKPATALSYGHVTGSLVDVQDDQVTIMDTTGNLVTGLSPVEGSRPLEPGQIVTALVQQDLETGALSVLGAESAEAKIGRAVGALDAALEAGAQANAKALAVRLTGATTARLTALDDISMRVGPGLRSVLSSRLQEATRKAQQTLARLDLGLPTAVLKGILQDVDPVGGTAFVSPRPDLETQVLLTQETVIRVFGEVSTAEQLEVGQRVEILYQPQTNVALTIEVAFPSLEDDTKGSLLGQARSGEVEGVVAVTGPGSLVVRTPSDHLIALSTSPDTRVRVGGQPAEASQLSRGAQVKVRFDPANMGALQIDTFESRSGQPFVSGVVRVFIPKIRPGIRIPGAQEEGNLLISDLEGQDLVLNVTEETEIEREGLLGTIALIAPGDLVRPTSRYDSRNGDVLKLALRAPVLRGTIRGTGVDASGARLLTLSSDALHLVTVTLAEGAQILLVREGVEDPGNFGELRPGQRVVSGAYNPQTLSATRLVVQAPKTSRAAGTVVDLDRGQGILTIATPGGQTLTLLVPDKPGKVFVNGRPGSIEDIALQDLVSRVFYRPDTEVVRVEVRSP